jgi:hypothetical protein
MFTDITTALSSIKVASDLVTLVLKAKVDAAVTQKAIELQGAIISLQSTILSIQAENQNFLAENNSLKQQIVDMNNWESEAQKYSLTEVSPALSCMRSIRIRQEPNQAIGFVPTAIKRGKNLSCKKG